MRTCVLAAVGADAWRPLTRAQRGDSVLVASTPARGAGGALTARPCTARTGGARTDTAATGTWGAAQRARGSGGGVGTGRGGSRRRGPVTASTGGGGARRSCLCATGGVEARRALARHRGAALWVDRGSAQRRGSTASRGLTLRACQCRLPLLLLRIFGCLLLTSCLLCWWDGLLTNRCLCFSCHRCRNLTATADITAALTVTLIITVTFVGRTAFTGLL